MSDRMVNLSAAALLAGAVLLGSACEDPPATGRCTPGSEPESCTCDGDVPGTRVCGDDGVRALCNCPSGPQAPKVMLLLDRSRTLAEAFFEPETTPACSDSATYAYLPGTPNTCKWNELTRALSGLLEQKKDLARFGLAVFPGLTSSLENPCVPGQVLTPVPVAAGDVSSLVRRLEIMAPAGGSLAASLRILGQRAAFTQPEPGLQRFVVLLTDGLPNCNANLQAACDQCSAAPATCFDPGTCKPTGRSTPGLPPCQVATQCNDELDAVAAVTALREAGIETFVIGVGADVAVPAASAAFGAMAVAGGRARARDLAYYHASSIAQLEPILSEVLERIVEPVVADGLRSRDGTCAGALPAAVAGELRGGGLAGAAAALDVRQSTNPSPSSSVPLAQRSPAFSPQIPRA